MNPNLKKWERPFWILGRSTLWGLRAWPEFESCLCSSMAEMAVHITVVDWCHASIPRWRNKNTFQTPLQLVVRMWFHPTPGQSEEAEVKFRAIFLWFLVFLLESMVVVAWFRSCQELSSVTGGFLILRGRNPVRSMFLWCWHCFSKLSPQLSSLVFSIILLLFSIIHYLVIHLFLLKPAKRILLFVMKPTELLNLSVMASGVFPWLGFTAAPSVLFPVCFWLGFSLSRLGAWKGSSGHFEACTHSWLIGKDPDAGKDWRQKEREEGNRMRWVDGITDSKDMNLGKIWEMVRDREKYQ